MNTETQNYETERKILDSGNRRVFSTGAVRDIAEGKGRCDLLPLHIVANLYSIWDTDKMKNPKYATTADILRHVETFIRNGNKAEIYDALFEFRTRFIMVGAEHLNLAGMLLEVSKHYEEGAKKYAERNWEAGIPCHCYIDSAIRHLIKWADNWDDEPHDRAVVWNLFGLLWTIDNHPDLNDLPYTKTKLSEEEKDYIKKDIQLTKEAYHRIINDNYDNPLQAADDINELVDALEKGDEIHKIYKGFSVDFNPGICISCSSFAGTYKKCDKGVMVNSKIVDCNKYGMESEVTENGNT